MSTIRISEKKGTYKYRRFMRDGTTEERTAVIRSKSANRKRSKTTGRKL